MRYSVARLVVSFCRKCVKGRRFEKTETLSIMILRKRFAVIRDEPNRANGLAGLVLCLWRGYSLRMWAMVVLLFDIDCICEMGSCPWNDFLARGATLSMAGNARRGPHCIGIVFLCQEWRLWGLFFAGRDFAMKSMLPLTRHNVFLTASHSPFLELLTLQKGPIAPFSATTAIAWMHVAYCQASLLPAAPCERSLFLLSPHAESRCASYRCMSNLRVPPAALTPSKHTLHFAVTCVSRS